MKCTLAYPKIPGPSNCPLKQCIAFEKLDGTNLHFRFERSESGPLRLAAFGVRRARYPMTSQGLEEFCATHPELMDAVHNILLLISRLSPFLNAQDAFASSQVVTVFAEYAGQLSFAGRHSVLDSTKRLYLFDCEVDDKMLPPERFLTLFKEFQDVMPKVIFRGKYSGQLVEDIRQGKFKVEEGAVIKGLVKGQVVMCKVKTNSYLKKLQEKFAEDWENYWE